MSNPAPEPILKGRFNLYEAPDGSFVIVYIADGETETRRLDIPAMVIRMARMSAEGKLNPVKALKEMMTDAST
jgi:hypothetical protein